MFLVGKPEYLATAPTGTAPSPQQDAENGLPREVKVSGTGPERIENWGILEACRQISAVRHTSEARARAIRDRPLPPRDSELSQSKRFRERDLFDQLIPENAQ
jgi:hypothetical protein